MINQCPEDVIKLLGDYWTLRIIQALQNDEMRFCQLQRKIDNVNPVTLTNRLKNLEKSGIIKRSNGGENKNSVSYNLTIIGKQSLPIIQSLSDFAQTLNNSRQG